MRKVLAVILMMITVLSVLLLSSCGDVPNPHLDRWEKADVDIEYTILEVQDGSFEYDGRMIVIKLIHAVAPPSTDPPFFRASPDPMPFGEPQETLYDVAGLMKNIILDFIETIDVNSVHVWLYYEGGDTTRREEPDGMMVFAPHGTVIAAYTVEAGDYETFEFSWLW